MGHVDEFCIANAAGATARRCPRSSTRRQKRVVGLPQGKSLGSSNFGGLIPPINQWNMWNWWVNYSQNTSNLQHPAIVSSIVNRNVKNYILGGFSSCGSSRQSVDPPVFWNQSRCLPDCRDGSWSSQNWAVEIHSTWSLSKPNAVTNLVRPYSRMESVENHVGHLVNRLGGLLSPFLSFMKTSRFYSQVES
jgi:hypothetical protein